MPRRRRIHHLSAVYHVMLRGNYRQDIFLNDNDRNYFLHLLEQAIIKFDCKIHLFCLMTNHVHLVVEVNNIPLWKIMLSIASTYSRYNHKQTNRKGHLFQGRYKAKLVRDEKYLLELCFYIHLNPLKAGIIHNLDLYDWSSHLDYSNRRKLPWLSIDFISSIIKREVKIDPNPSYIDFIRN